MDMETVLRRLAEAHSMISDLRDGYSMRELCRDVEEWLTDARETLERTGWSICD